MDFYSDSERNAGKVDGEEYREQTRTAKFQAERERSFGGPDEWEPGNRRLGESEPDERKDSDSDGRVSGESRVSRSRMDRRNKPDHSEGEEAEVNPAARTSSNSRSSSSSASRTGSNSKPWTKSIPSLKGLNVKMPPVKVNLILKVAAVIAVLINLRFVMGLMKDPVGSFTFYHLLIELAISAGVNLAAVWILFAKRSQIRYYLSLFAVLGSFLYYFYGNYTNHTLLVRSTLFPSALMVVSVLMMANSRSNYYLKSIMMMVIAAVGIYVSSNQFALEWMLLGSAGLVMFFRMSKQKAKDKSGKKESRGRRNQQQSA